MGYKQKSGPLQRAGYDKDATSPFRQDNDSTSGEELKEFTGTGKKTSYKKDDIKKVIESQKQYDRNTEASARYLAEIDSLTRVAQGPEGAKQANYLYGKKFNSNSSYLFDNAYSGKKQKDRTAQYNKLREEAKKTQGPRPTL